MIYESTLNVKSMSALTKQSMRQLSLALSECSGGKNFCVKTVNLGLSRSNDRAGETHGRQNFARNDLSGIGMSEFGSDNTVKNYMTFMNDGLIEFKPVDLSKR